jgi:hypothetical protein
MKRQSVCGHATFCKKQISCGLMQIKKIQKATRNWFHLSTLDKRQYIFKPLFYLVAGVRDYGYSGSQSGCACRYRWTSGHAFAEDAGTCAAQFVLYRERLNQDELCAFSADPTHIGEPYLGRYVVWESSGTGGQPGMFVQNDEAMAVYDALETLRRSALRPLGPSMAQTTRSFSILQSTNALVSSLNAFNPTAIATDPTAAALLADEAEKETCRST